MVLRPLRLSGNRTNTGHLRKHLLSAIAVGALLLPSLLAGSNDSAPLMQWSSSGKHLAILGRRDAHSGASLDVLDIATGERRTLLSSERLSALEKAFQRDETIQVIWTQHDDSVLLTSAHWLVQVYLHTAKQRVVLTSDDVLGHFALAPLGTKISFVKHHRLWLLDLKDGLVAPLQEEIDPHVLQGELDSQYEQGFKLSDAYWWSPDGSHIAFFETRDPQTGAGSEASLNNDRAIPTIKLRVASTSNQREKARTLLANRAGEYIVRATWFPDSKRIAVEKVNSEQNELTLSAIDREGGEPRILLTEHDKYWVNLAAPPFFLSQQGNDFLWLSERNGYRHLYLYKNNGRLVRQLSNGNWEVRSLIGVDEERQLVYFSAGKDNPAELNLYRLRWYGSEPTRLTRSPGWHLISASPNNTRFTDIISDVSTPPYAELLDDRGKVLQRLSPPSNADESVRSEFVTLTTHDDVVLHGLFLKPAVMQENRRYPLVMEAGGGPGEQIVKNAWDEHISLWNQLLVQHGFIVFAMDPRGASGYGHVFEEPVHYWLGGQESADERDAVFFLRRISFVDARRIGIWGSRYGGKLAVEALIHEPDDFKAAYAQFPIVDWLHYNSIFAERYLGPAKDRGEEYRQSSLLEDAERLNGPLLISAAKTDDFESPADIVQLRSALTQSGGSPRMQMVEPNDDALADYWVKQVLPFFESALH